MRSIDLLSFPLGSLGRHKLRTCLTTLGVVFGTFVLAASLSINEGSPADDRAAESSKGDISRKVTVFPRWREAETKVAEDVKVAGRMSPPRRERIRKTLSERARQRVSGQQINLTHDRLEALSRIPHVLRMIPIVGSGVVATLGNRPEEASVSSEAGEAPRVPQADPRRPGVRLETTSERCCSPRCSRTGSV